MSKTLARLSVAVAVALTAVAGCGGSGEPTDTSTMSDPAETATPAEPATSPGSATTDGEDPAGSGTSIEDPAPAGTPVVVEVESGSWEITFDEPDRDTAQQQIEEGWVELDEGETLLIVPVSATYSGEGNAVVTSDVNFGYVSATGETYPADPLGPLGADPLMDVGPVFDGGTAQGNLMFVVPESSDPGVWWVIDVALQTPGMFVEAPPATP